MMNQFNEKPVLDQEIFDGSMAQKWIHEIWISQSPISDRVGNMSNISASASASLLKHYIRRYLIIT